jgi:hypothetical protein
LLVGFTVRPPSFFVIVSFWQEVAEAATAVIDTPSVIA